MKIVSTVYKMFASLYAYIHLALRRGELKTKQETPSTGFLVVGVPEALPGSPAALVQAQHHAAADFDQERVTRQQVSRFQQEFLNTLIVEANVDLSNYLPSVFENIALEAPGGKLARISALGELFMTLNSGEFTPNVALNEKPITKEFYEKTRLEMEKKHGVW